MSNKYIHADRGDIVFVKPLNGSHYFQADLEPRRYLTDAERTDINGGPRITSAVVPAAGDVVKFTFDRPIALTANTLGLTFAASVGGAVTASAWSLALVSGFPVLTITLSRTVTDATVLTYTLSTSKIASAISYAAIANAATQAITNNSTQT